MNKWKKLIAGFCAASMLMTMPGGSVYAAEPQHEESIESIEAIADEAEIDGDFQKDSSVYEEPDIAAEAEPSDDFNALTDMVEEPAEDAVLPEAETPDPEEQEDSAETVDLPEEYSLPAEDATVEEKVGVDTGIYEVGDGVIAFYNADEGSVYFANNNAGSGVLWRDWYKKAGIDKYSVKSIGVLRDFLGNSLEKVKLPADSKEIFSWLSYMTTIDLSGFDTSNVTDMSHMFFSCESLKNLNLSVLDTSKVTNMHAMFSCCKSLKTLNLSSFDTAKVTNMGYMFSGCYDLTSIDFTKVNTSKVTDMRGMFQMCESLKTLDLTGFNTSKVTDMMAMFFSCRSLEKLDLGRFDTSNVELMDEMFGECSGLTRLNLNNFKTPKVTNTSYMFIDCTNLKYLDIGSFDMSKVTDAAKMFKACYALEILITPKNRKNTSECYFSHPMYDRNGKVYYQLPVDTPSMVLGKTKALAASIFIDVREPSHAYYNAIYWAVDKGITKGYSDGTFGINKSCTRGEMVMFLWRYAGKPAPKYVSKSPFKDVPTSHTFYKAILWAYQKGITKGYSDGTFGVNRNVSRGESMMFLWRLKGKKDPTAVSVSPFKDVPKTHTFYKAILWGYQKKITTGYTSGAKKGTFGINENCTRGQIVTFLYRARNL